MKEVRTEQASLAPAQQGHGNAGLEGSQGGQSGKGKLSQLWSVRKNSITPAQFHESLRKQAVESVGKQALKRRQGVVEKAKELTRKNSPQKKAAACESLPADFLLLEKYFECLEAASSLLRTRRKMCTFSAVAKTVETMTGRRFTRKHLGQIKYVFPEVLGLELVSYKDPDTERTTRDLKLSLLPIGVESGRGAGAVDASPGKEKYRTKEVSRKEEFRAKLLAHLREHGRDEEIPVAVLPQHYSAADSGLKAAVRGPSSPKSSTLASEFVSQRSKISCDGSTDEDTGFRAASDVALSAAREEEEEDVEQMESPNMSHMSHFGPLFRPFFSVKTESVLSSPPAEPLTESLNCPTSPESAPESISEEFSVHVSHFRPLFKPFFSVRKAVSSPTEPRVYPDKVSDQELPVQSLESNSFSESPSLHDLSQTPSAVCEKTPLANLAKSSPFSLRPCDSARCQTAADMSPCPSASRDLVSASPFPTTPFQPSPFVGYSQQFVARNSSSTPLQPSAVRASAKPLFSTPPVRQQTAVRELRFGTPAPSADTDPNRSQDYSDPACEDDGGKSILPRAVFSGRCVEESATPAKSRHFHGMDGSPYLRSGSFSSPSCSLGGTPDCIGGPFGTPSCSTPLRIYEATPGAQNDYSSPAAVLAPRPKEFTTPKRSRVNLGLIFDQESEGKEARTTFKSPSKKFHAAVADEVQDEATPGAPYESSPAPGLPPRPKDFTTPKRSRVNLGLVFGQDSESAEARTTPSRKLHAALGDEVQDEGTAEAHSQDLQLMERRRSKGKTAGVTSQPVPKVDADIVKCLPTGLVKSVQEAERRALEEQNEGVLALRKLNKMKADMPKLLSTVRQIFQGRSVLPHQVLLSKVLSSSGEMSDSVEAEEKLQLLLELAPDWISMKTSLTGDRLYRISKAVDVVSIRKRLAFPV